MKRKQKRAYGGKALRMITPAEAIANNNINIAKAQYEAEKAAAPYGAISDTLIGIGSQLVGMNMQQQKNKQDQEITGSNVNLNYEQPEPNFNTDIPATAFSPNASKYQLPELSVNDFGMGNIGMTNRKNKTFEYVPNNPSFATGGEIGSILGFGLDTLGQSSNNKFLKGASKFSSLLPMVGGIFDAFSESSGELNPYDTQMRNKANDNASFAYRFDTGGGPIKKKRAGQKETVQMTPEEYTHSQQQLDSVFGKTYDNYHPIESDNVKTQYTPYDKVNPSLRFKGRYTIQDLGNGKMAVVGTDKIFNNKNNFEILFNDVLSNNPNSNLLFDLDESFATTRRNFEKNKFANQTRAFGGNVDDVPIETEGQEIVQEPNGEMYELQGPSHEQGGIDMQVPEGSQIYSKRLQGVDGKTMAERKAFREKRLAKLEALVKRNHNDKILRRTFEKTKKDFAKQEQEDMAYMNYMHQSQQMQQGQEEILDPMQSNLEQEDMFAMGGPAKKTIRPIKYRSKLYNPVGEYKVTDDIENPEVIIKTPALSTPGFNPPVNPNIDYLPLTEEDLKNKAYREQFIRKGTIPMESNIIPGLNKKIPYPSMKASQAFEKPINSDYEAYYDKYGNLKYKLKNSSSGANESVESGSMTNNNGTKNNTNNNNDDESFWNKAYDALPTLGDAINLYGKYKAAYDPADMTLANRAGDTPNINPYENYSVRGLNKMEDVKNNLKNNLDQAVLNNQKNTNLYKANASSNARSINTMRAMNLASEAQQLAADNAAYMQYAQQVAGIDSQIAQMMNQQDQMQMMGNGQRDLADRQDRDNFNKQLQQDIATRNRGIQEIGKTLNDWKERDFNFNVVNQTSKDFKINKNGTISAKGNESTWTPEKRYWNGKQQSEYDNYLKNYKTKGYFIEGDTMYDKDGKEVDPNNHYAVVPGGKEFDLSGKKKAEKELEKKKIEAFNRISGTNFEDYFDSVDDMLNSKKAYDDNEWSEEGKKYAKYQQDFLNNEERYNNFRNFTGKNGETFKSAKSMRDYEYLNGKATEVEEKKKDISKLISGAGGKETRIDGLYEFKVSRPATKKGGKPTQDTIEVDKELVEKMQDNFEALNHDSNKSIFDVSDDKVIEFWNKLIPGIYKDKDNVALNKIKLKFETLRR